MVSCPVIEPFLLHPPPPPPPPPPPAASWKWIVGQWTVCEPQNNPNLGHKVHRGLNLGHGIKAGLRKLIDAQSFTSLQSAFKSQLECISIDRRNRSAALHCSGATNCGWVHSDKLAQTVAWGRSAGNGPAFCKMHQCASTENASICIHIMQRAVFKSVLYGS